MSRQIGSRRGLGATLAAAIASPLALPAGSQRQHAPRWAPRLHRRRAHVPRHQRPAHRAVFTRRASRRPTTSNTGPTVAYGSQTPTPRAPAAAGQGQGGPARRGLPARATYHYRHRRRHRRQTHDPRHATGPSSPANREQARVRRRQAEPHLTCSAARVAVSGTLSGLGNANQPIALQASPYPFLEPFMNVGAAGATDAVGSFSFRVASLTRAPSSASSRSDRGPVYSPVVTEHVAPKVTLHVRSTEPHGLRAPLRDGRPRAGRAPLLFQLLKPSQAARQSRKVRADTRPQSSAPSLKRGHVDVLALQRDREQSGTRAATARSSGSPRDRCVSGAQHQHAIRAAAPDRATKRTHH